MTDDDGVLSRWSRRKRAAKNPEPAPAPEPRQSPPPEELSEEAWLEQHELPEPESLGDGDDFSAYLKDGVPELLRRRALRQLWRANPVLANLDGLVEYGEDFTDAALVPDVIATAYKVGRGFASKIAEAVGEEEDPAEAPEPAAVDQDVAAARLPEAPPEPAEGLPEEPAGQSDEESDEDEFRPRRMAFRSE